MGVTAKLREVSRSAITSVWRCSPLAERLELALRLIRHEAEADVASAVRLPLEDVLLERVLLQSKMEAVSLQSRVECMRSGVGPCMVLCLNASSSNTPPTT